MKKRLIGAISLLWLFSVTTQAETVPDEMHHVLDNGKVRLRFECRGERLALASIQRLPDGTAISMEPYSADWRINLKTRSHPRAALSLALSAMRAVKPEGIDGKMAAGADWFEAHWSRVEDKDADVSLHTEGEMHLKGIDADRTRLKATWEGKGRIFDESCRFEVTTHWSLKPGDFKAHTSIEVKVLPVEGQDRSAIYLSSVDYPIYRIQAIGEDDYLAAPWIGGHLYHHPTKNKVSVYADEPGPIKMPVYAYYDKGTGDCLYICNTDVTGHFKIHETRTLDGYLFHRTHQIPPDMFESRHYKQPYEDVLGVLEGDWITAAETYREFLAENAAWYMGPVGSRANRMPQRLKDSMVTATLQFGPVPGEFPELTREQIEEQLKMPGVRNPWKETEDALGKDLKLLGETFECPVFSIWYAGPYEGSDGAREGTSAVEGRARAAYCDDLTQEAPNLAAAVAIGQEDSENVVAPYMFGKNGYLYVLNQKDRGPYTARNYGVLASAIVAEDGSFAVQGRDNTTHLCPASPWWNEHLASVVADHHRRWGIRGIYLDYYMAFHTCYSERHGHEPGGGDFVTQGKIRQMRRMRELAVEQGLDDLVIAMEGIGGAYTTEANIGNRHILSNWGFIAESEAIPYIEWVFDNVKYCRISGQGGRTSHEGTGLWSWYVAIEVLQFGHVVSVGNGLSNYQEIFGYAEGRPYYDFVVRLVNVLKSEGFKKYHNGSLARPLEGEVTPEGNFHVPLLPPFKRQEKQEELYFDASSDGNTLYAKPYILSVMPRGVFKSANGDLAFAICNPWVGPNPFSDVKAFTYDFTFDPAKYKGFPTTYRLTKVQADGESVVFGERSGPTRLAGELGPAEIEYWTFVRR